MSSARKVTAYGLSVLIAWGALQYGRATAPQAEPVYVPTESRADCLEVRLAPSDDGSRLIVRTWLWDGDGGPVDARP